MEWLVVALVVFLAGYGEGGALRCSSTSQDPSCIGELETVPKKPRLPFGKECAAGTHWRSQCNDCGCSEQGLHFCTEKACIDREPEPQMSCAPASMWSDDCNTCVCTDDGIAKCTLRDCDNKDSSLKSALAESASSENKTKRVVCVANRMFIKDCNTCWCNDDGTGFFCTRKVCVPDIPEEIEPEEKPEDLHEIKRECRPDEVFELDCNMCRCNPDGKSFSCTRRICVEHPDEDIKNQSLTRRIRGANDKEVPKNCEPNQKFRMDCNMCLCDDKGAFFSCTRMDCDAQKPQNGEVRTKRDTSRRVELECSPGSVFNRDCNACRCSADGHHATCTVKPCSTGAQDNDVNSPLPEADPNFRCTPGEQFKRRCNDCSCSADGKSIFCTVRLCDQDITPPTSE